MQWVVLRKTPKKQSPGFLKETEITHKSLTIRVCDPDSDTTTNIQDHGDEGGKLDDVNVLNMYPFATQISRLKFDYYPLLSKYK